MMGHEVMRAEVKPVLTSYLKAYLDIVEVGNVDEVWYCKGDDNLDMLLMEFEVVFDVPVRKVFACLSDDEADLIFEKLGGREKVSFSKDWNWT